MWWKWLLNFLTGDIAGALAKAYEAKQKALTDGERIEADVRIRQLEARQAVQIEESESGSRTNARMRAFIASGPAIYLFKIFAIDKVVCPPVGLSCSTDPLSPELWQVVAWVLGFYFVVDGSIAVTKIIKRK